MGDFFSDLGNSLGNALPAAAGYMIGGVPGAIIGSSIGSGMGVAQTNSANQAIMQQNNQFNAEQADINRAWSADQAQKQMDFQLAMSNTQWQRGVRDMEMAGLSPMLAYMKGGASAPSGAMGSSSAASSGGNIPMQNVGGGVLAGLQSAVQMANVIADTENKKATTGLIAAQTTLTDAQVGQVNAAVDKIKAEIPQIEGNTNFAVQQDILVQTARKIQQEVASINQGTATSEQQQQLLNATVRKVVSETTLNNLDIKAATSLGNIGRDAGQLKPIIDMLISAIRVSRGR